MGSIKFLLIVACAVTVIEGGYYQSLTPEQINESLAWVPPPQLKNLSYILSGYDDEGSPVYIVEYGKWFDGNILSQMKNDVLKYAQQMHLRMYLAGKEPPGLGAIVIKDMAYDESYHAHPTVQQIFLEGGKNLQNLLDDGALKKFILINADKRAMKTAAKILPTLGRLGLYTAAYGTNPLVWIPKILEQINPGQLPPKYAGRNVFTPVESYP